MNEIEIQSSQDSHLGLQNASQTLLPTEPLEDSYISIDTV